MSITVCLCPTSVVNYPKGAGHFWVYLNWALGLRSLGCQVIWLEKANPKTPEHIFAANADILRSRLQRYGFEDCLAFYSGKGEPLPRNLARHFLDFDAATQADLLLNQQYRMSPEVVRRFRRSALLDIDPGLLQIWMSEGLIRVAPHDVYFTIGETVGRPDAGFPDAGVEWRYTPPCVALDWWPVQSAVKDAPFTTVSHWYGGSWVKDRKDSYQNDKRTSFLPFLDLPRRTAEPLELALCLGGDRAFDEQERKTLQELGWRVRDSWDVASTPWDYQRYIQNSRGEFSCVKPSCIRLQNAWVSDRTLCYLASGKPAIIQHTGPSRFLPDSAGLLRFRDMEEAVRCLETAATDYEHQCHLARDLAEEYFNARKVVGSLLERALA